MNTSIAITTDHTDLTDQEVALAARLAARMVAMGAEQETVVAEHDEAEDVELVMKAIEIVRELIAREARDGKPDDFWELQDLVQALKDLGFVMWNEEWDVERMEDATAAAKQRVATAGAQSEEANGGEEMALNEETKAEIAEVVANALATTQNPLLEALQAQTAAIASLAEAMKPAPVAEPTATAGEEKPEEGDEVAAEAPEVPATEAKVEEDEKVEAEAASPAPATTQEPVVEAEPPAAEASAEDDLEAQLQEARESTEEDADDALENALGGSSSAGAGVSSYRLKGKGGVETYLESVARANGITLDQRVPVGVQSAPGTAAASVSSTDDLAAQLLTIFRR